MTIPALSTADKLFICSYSIGSNIDHRLALGIINKIITFTSEYVEGECWIPVNWSTENNHSWYWDAPDKDVVYVKVGVRCSADGYLHAWLLNTQEISELIIWDNNYNDTNQPIDDTTTLYMCIEKMYRSVIGNTTAFVVSNIKFQNYITGGSRLYLFGNYSNSLTHRAAYTGGGGTVVDAGVSWYPNNSTTILSDFIYTSDTVWDCWILWNYDNETDGWRIFDRVDLDKAWLYDGGVYTDYTTKLNNSEEDDVPLMPTLEAVNDAFYFGCADKFDILTITIGIAGVGNTIVWEYWNGSAWVSLSVTDNTNGYTTIGTNDITFTVPSNWAKNTVNGYNTYYIRSRVSVASYTTQPIASGGRVKTSSSIWSKARPPIFVESYSDTITEPITSYCAPPSGSQLKVVTYCYDYLHANTCIGNNSGRSYQMYFGITIPPGCGDMTCDQRSVTNVSYTIDMAPNTAYIWVPGYCQGASGGTQSECEGNGGTWIPGHYECDPSFTYDTSVTFDLNKIRTISATEIDYVNCRAKFSGVADGNKVFCDYAYPTSPIGTFNEWLGDLDQLKHQSAANIDANSIYTIFTKHVAWGLLTGAVDLTLTSDWVITWGTAEYFSNWQTPDGLSARTPAVTNIPYTRPVTYHDEFDTTDLLLGGFLYEPLTSNAFLSRDPGTETKITYPVNNQSDFNFIYGLVTSNAFLSRDPGTETKIEFSVSKGDFDYLYKLLTSNGFLNRDPGIENKIEFPVGNADFCFLYELLKPIIADLYYLKPTGDDTKDGKSWGEAWKTWTHSMINTPNERTLLVEEGTYSFESQVNPDNSIVIYLTKNYIDDVSTVTVTLV